MGDGGGCLPQPPALPFHVCLTSLCEPPKLALLSSTAMDDEISPSGRLPFSAGSMSTSKSQTDFEDSSSSPEKAGSVNV